MHVTWKGFLRRFPRVPGARMLLQIGGDFPGRTAERIMAAYHKNGDEESLEIRLHALDEFEETYKRGYPEVVEYTDDDWIPVQGGRMRRNHIEADYNDGLVT